MKFLTLIFVYVLTRNRYVIFFIIIINGEQNRRWLEMRLEQNLSSIGISNLGEISYVRKTLL